MPTKSTIKLIKQLQQKKYRKKYELFVVEGRKSVQEFINSSYKIKYFFVTEDLISEFPSADLISEKEMKTISNVVTPPNVLAVFEQPKLDIPNELKHINIALDNIQDPGNLGTIIRLADWFGVEHIFCNENTVDLYNPKVVQASMGSISRVKVHYVDLENFIQKTDIPIIGTFMNGDNIYQTKFPENALLIMGNEANGISPEIEKLCTQKITIPQNGQGTESLNVAIASAIIIGEVFANRFR